MQHLMENWRKYQNNPFQLLCEQHDKYLISEEQLFKIWEQNTLNEYTKLCEIDWEKEIEKGTRT